MRERLVYRRPKEQRHIGMNGNRGILSGEEGVV